MKDEYPLLPEYKKTVQEKLDLLRLLITEIKKGPTLKNLEELQKEVHKLFRTAGAYGYSEASELCQKLEIDLFAKIKNFNLAAISSTWFSELDTFLEKLKTAFSDHRGTVMQDTTRSATKKKIIVVDDDEDIVKLLTYEFRGLGFEVQSFASGTPALSFLLQEDNLQDVYLVILDRMLPDMDGLDILRDFSKKFPQKVPVLILSVLGSEGDVLAGLQTGAIDYVTKPFSVFKLMQKAINLIGR